jgi:hypothetical protein
MEEILWTGADVHDKRSGYLDLKSEGKKAAQEAARKDDHVLWGLPPFLRLKRQGPINLTPLVVGDSIFQRIMVREFHNSDCLPANP